MSSTRSRKKPSTEEALKDVNDLIQQQQESTKKKPRKPVRFEINTDPKTGHRDIKGTYQPTSSKKSRCQDVHELHNSVDEPCEPGDLELDLDVSKEESLDSMISYCESLLSLTNENYSARTHITWKKRMLAAKENWACSRESIFNIAVSQEGYAVEQCHICEQRKAFVRCNMCGLSLYLCEQCDQEIHSKNPFHDREIWNGNFLKLFVPWRSLMDRVILSQENNVLCYH